MIAWTMNGENVLRNAEVNAYFVESFDGKRTVRRAVGYNERLTVNETPKLFIK